MLLVLVVAGAGLSLFSGHSVGLQHEVKNVCFHYGWGSTGQDVDVNCTVSIDRTVSAWQQHCSIADSRAPSRMHLL